MLFVLFCERVVVVVVVAVVVSMDLSASQFVRCKLVEKQENFMTKLSHESRIGGSHCVT
jgi:hypothetical protein